MKKESNASARPQGYGSWTEFRQAIDPEIKAKMPSRDFDVELPLAASPKRRVGGYHTKTWAR